MVVVLGFLAKTYFFKNTGTGLGIEIVWWGLWEDEATASSIISGYQAKNPNVKIKYVKQSKEDYRERLTNALAKGTGPDIFRYHNTWVPMFKSELDRIPASIYSAGDFANTFYPITVADLTNGASLVGIPLEYDGLTLFINEDIFEQSGKSIPTTWNDVRQTSRELTIKDERGSITQSGIALGRTENVDHWPEILGLMMLQNGVDLTHPIGKLAEDALEFYTIFSSVDGVWDATLPSSTVAFAGGKTAMYLGPSWRAFEIRLQNPNLRFKTVPVPQLPKTSANEPDVNYASYWVEGVSLKSKNKVESWKFLKHLSEKENLQSFYQTASKLRMFGEPYPRVDMETLLSDHPIIGSTVSGAKLAQTWFLQSRTWDGPTGINSQINKYFEDAVNAVNSGKEPSKVLEPVASGVIQVLSQYGIKVQ
ncbi:MAG: Extracellular solute-binding protein family 1 [Candidatus Woesebacteria bacterium GW2011_GWC2_33_12]|uniref:Extracellular solute-binding protein family 1 n=1 Tax=Candidatus Woesebacteria bacterium GW2011_GWB1_33_22 TaxID=1618566 RepID=A0A0G0CLM7_9BACT|nr:MAG: Extracellular solute-binding protein family 1 [Candidatus Woesebacteria bacterium GW2011_GWC2_33_12]KKP41815.1 MAG: Extracellular solute-binding protein family 1 [Candidatus Woesebacteria bacterium GW2011_GWA2_33_20]KKP44327.1 MAG: Extracellular solute-binding protein family 1 [Candidatus Woesebacteria bacterium GW2011_GWB1_33_22]KKP46085.1 MAG: Extracellular solute-binding protein family 1 [Microgenomates group bacterium GW2011_GWC1_33_28]KKP49975.1 MAG: Extracellular solute-binding pr